MDYSFNLCFCSSFCESLFSAFNLFVSQMWIHFVLWASRHEVSQVNVSSLMHEILLIFTQERLISTQTCQFFLVFDRFIPTNMDIMGGPGLDPCDVNTCKQDLFPLTKSLNVFFPKAHRSFAQIWPQHAESLLLESNWCHTLHINTLITVIPADKAESFFLFNWLDFKQQLLLFRLILHYVWKPDIINEQLPVNVLSTWDSRVRRRHAILNMLK